MAPSLVHAEEKSGPVTINSDDHDEGAELVYGFPDESETNFSRGRFPSKIGGKPVFLLAEAFETPRCSVCASKLRFLLQIYAPVSENPAAFHRTLYIYVCANSSSCTLKPGADSVVVIRAQLPRRNSVYPYNFSGDDEVKDLLDTPSLCALCGGKARERCGGCGSVQYCSRDCQKQDWCLGHKYVCKKTGDCSDATEKLRENRKNWLFCEVSLETAVCSDDEDEEYSDEESESDEENELPRVSEVLDGERNGRVEGSGGCELAENGDVNQEGDATAVGSSGVVAPDSGAAIVSKAEGCGVAEKASAATGSLDGLATMQDASAEELPECLFKSRFRADAIFDRFTRMTRYPPDQVVRYQRGGSVLWMHSGGQRVPSDDGENCCSFCGGALTFELQVLPQLLYYINPKTSDSNGERASIGDVAKHLSEGLDWGVIAIWTCAASCTPTMPGNSDTSPIRSEYVRESHVWLQPAPSSQEFPA